MTLILVCAECGAVNRVPSGRLRDRPICGKCKQQLVTGKPVTLSGSVFSKFISRSSIPVLVDFWAPWCGPCRMMAPEFEKAAAQLSPSVILAKLDTEAFPGPAAPLGISGIPTIILFDQGKEIARHSGMIDAVQISDWVSGKV